jgi:hypothetical protein
MLSPDSQAQRACRQAETPLSALSRFPEPALDAIRDVTNRGEVVLDVFGGSGTTLIAAEKTGRCGRLIEIDPIYCDVIVRRWEKLTGCKAVLSVSGDTFEDVTNLRGVPAATDIAEAA